MLKKLLALICVMAVLFTSFTFTTVSAAEEFAPVGLMLQPDVRNDGSYMTISWRNPTSNTLSAVKLYDVTSGTATLVDNITKDGAVTTFSDSISNQYLIGNTTTRLDKNFVWYRLASLTPGTYKKYRLDFEFSDVSNNKSYYLAAAPVAQTTNGASKTISNKISTYDSMASTTNFPYLPMGLETITEEGGNVALKVRFNVTGWYSNSTYGQLLYNFTPTVGKTYKVGFDYKGTPSDNNRVGVYVRDTSTDTDIDNLPDTETTKVEGIVIKNVSEWKTHTYEGIFTPTTTNVKFKFKFLNPVEEIILDNFFVKECDAEGNILEGATNLVSNGDLSNLTNALSSAKNLSGKAGNEKATIEWENDSSARYYKIYKDGAFYGIAYPESDGTTSVEFDNLINDETYTFGVSAYNQAFAEGEIKTVDVTPKEPAPKNPMISNLSVNTYTFGGTGGALTVSFKNPEVEDITSIELYDVNGDSETKISDTAFSLDAGAVNAYVIKNLTNSTLYNYKLRVTTTSDGLKEYDIAAKPGAGAYAMNFNTDSSNHYWNKTFGRKDSNTPYPPVDFRIVQNPLSETKDYVLNVVSNIKSYVDGNYANLTYNFTDQMASGTTYRLKFDYMTLAGGSRPSVYVNNSEIGKINLASDGWQKASFDFTNKNASTNVIKFGFVNPLESLYIDNLAIVPVTDGVEGTNILTKGDFDVVEEETNEYSVIDVTAEAFDKGATINYTVSEVGKFIKIYEVTEFGKNLISIQQPTRNGTITLNNLKNNKTYNLIMTTQNWKDVEGDGYEFTVTPKPEDLVIGEFKLLKDAETSDTQNLTGGTYKANVSVKNNGMGDNFTAQLIVAVYNDKKLVLAKASEKTTIAQTDSELAGTPLTVENVSIPSVDDGDYTVKVMLWKSLDDMTPLKQFKPYAE
ncbi:MAG: hypothetical protein E7404_03945 [Ruminococcaceae bacterium]|nr:hypothetical protein [Oscillospiraceae bacterium]